MTAKDKILLASVTPYAVTAACLIGLAIATREVHTPVIRVLFAIGSISAAVQCGVSVYHGMKG